MLAELKILTAGSAFATQQVLPPFLGGSAPHRTPHVISGSGKRLAQQFRPKEGDWMDRVESSQEFQRPDQQF
jgi:hypothetical protein